MELEKQMKKMFGKQRGYREDFFFLFFFGYTRCSCCSGFSLVAVRGSYSLTVVHGLIVAASRPGAQARGHSLQPLHHTGSIVLTPRL